MAWQKEALERSTIWPYVVFENQVQLEVRGVLLRNGKQVGVPFQGKNWKSEKKSLNNAFLYWHVFNQQEPWDQIHLDLTLSLHKGELFWQTVFQSDSASLCRFAVDGLCKSTRWRHAVTAPFTESKASLKFSVKAEDVAGTAVILPSVLLWTERPASPLGQPKMKGSRVATGFPLQIQIDSPMQMPGKGIEVLWTPFPKEVSDSLYELIIEPPKPILKLNNEHPSLKVIFEEVSKAGNRAKIRNAIFAFIAADVWIQLAEFAANHLNRELESDDPSAELSEKIVRSLTKMLKCRAEEIFGSFEDFDSRSMLRLRLQHHLKTLSRQDALITGLVPDEEIQEFFQ